MNELEIINISELSLSEQDAYNLKIIRELHNTINTGNIYSFKKIIEKQDEDGKKEITLQKFSEKERKRIIEKSKIEESLSVSGYKLYYSKNENSILKIEKEMYLEEGFIPMLKDGGDNIGILMLLSSYIKVNLKKDINTDIFNIKEFEIFNKNTKQKLGNNDFKISDRLKDFVVKDEQNKDIFFFNEIFIDFVEHCYEKMKEKNSEEISNEN